MMHTHSRDRMGPGVTQPYGGLDWGHQENGSKAAIVAISRLALIYIHTAHHEARHALGVVG